MIVGLKTYEANIDKDKIVNYIELSSSHKNPNISFWRFLCAAFLLTINIYGKVIKNDYQEEYQFRKVAESFFRMSVPLDPELSN